MKAIQIPLVNIKVVQRIFTKAEWKHPELRQSMGGLNIKRAEYPQLMRELKKLDLVVVSKRSVVPKEEKRPTGP